MIHINAEYDILPKNKINFTIIYRQNINLFSKHLVRVQTAHESP